MVTIINQKAANIGRPNGIDSSAADALGNVELHNTPKINMYDVHPQNVISLHDFHSIALSRLQVLRKIQFLYDANKQNEEIHQEVNKYAHQRGLAFEGRFDKKMGQQLKYLPIPANEYQKCRSSDTISHFINRLAYCRNEELRKWFLQQETRFFNLRLQGLGHMEVKQLLSQNLDVHYEGLTEESPEWKTFKEQITFNSVRSEGGPAARDPTFYCKVPFKEALQLVSHRAVFLHKGIAFVPLNELGQIACSHFRMKLSQELIKAYKYLPNILKDQRLQNMLMALSNFNAIDFNLYEVKAPTGSDKVNLGDLDYHTQRSFPPCMKSLYQALKNHHHLKHYGRLQMGLFLKGIGLTMEESLLFWKNEFTKKHDIDGEKFEKNYAYNIRHSYGQEGKRNDYKPWNCNKTIALTQPGQGEYHGCPFKTFSEDNLKQVLASYGISRTDMEVVMGKKRENLYQVACLRLFESTHKGCVTDNVGNHPNAYFTSSRQYIKDTEKPRNQPKTSTTNTTTPAGQANQEKPVGKEKEDVEMATEEKPAEQKQ